VLDTLGKPKDALPLAQAARAEAERVPYAPLRAEALATLGLVQSHMADKSADATLLEAVRAAESAHHDELAAMAWTAVATR
jgi:hypothetical protein